MTKLFLDAEFTGLHQATTLISLALVADSGEEFYAEFTDYDKNQVDTWVQKNVVNHLFLTRDSTSHGALVLQGNEQEITWALKEWLKRFSSIEVWTDVGAYDWFLLRELFNGGASFPLNVFYIPFDLATLFKVLGIDSDVDREKFAATLGWTDSLPKHNALHDARVQKCCYEICRDLVHDGTKKAVLA